MFVFSKWLCCTAAVCVGLTIGGCSAHRVPKEVASPAVSRCSIRAAAPWIKRWTDAWDLTSRSILHLSSRRDPNFVFYDDSCVYTTSRVTAGAGSRERGVSLAKRLWWATSHDDSLTLPDSKRVPVSLMSFASSDWKSGPYFVMAAPAFWAKAANAQEPGLTAVLIHELSHTQQTPGLASIIDPIDSAWSYPEPLDDDIIQARFRSDSDYVRAYRAERDMIYRAAAAGSTDEVRKLATQALDMIRRRHARWFTGPNELFATLDATFLSLEGAGQWAGYAWLSNPNGGKLDRAAAIKTMRGGGWWSQDEGFGLFLVIDRLLPDWQSLVFHTPSIGTVELLERALTTQPALRPSNHRTAG